MIVNLNGTLVNTDNICTAKMYYQITRTPGEPEKKDYLRIHVVFIGGHKDSIEFDTKADMELAFTKLQA